MRKSIFDSESEKKVFKRLKTFWSRYVDIFPQVPVRNVIEYNELQKFDKNPKVVNFLLKTSFDFVVCELDTGIPILIVEFDGLSGGFSREGNFFIDIKPQKDRYRKLKMDTKLRLCSQFEIPMIVLSYEECRLLPESNDWITILDAVIGDAMEKKYRRKEYGKFVEMLTAAYESGGRDAIDAVDVEIDTICDLQNPIKLKIREITKGFPFWPMQIIFPREENGYIEGTFSFDFGLKKIDNKIHTKKLLTIDLRMRNIGIFDSDSLFLFNTIGEYCLARKTEEQLGEDVSAWEDRIKNTEWTS